MQCLRFSETSRMKGTHYYQMISTSLKLDLSGYDVKPRFGAFQCEYLLQNPPFLRKTFSGTRHLCEKKTHPRSFWGGGCTVRLAGS